MVDVRNFGLRRRWSCVRSTGRALEAFERGIDAGILLRFTGDILALALPSISREGEIFRTGEVLRDVQRRVA